MGTRTVGRHLEVEVLPELSRVAPRERRAAFALRLRARDDGAARPVGEEGVRRGMRLVLAVDRSSSMKGDKLEHARGAASLLVAMLGDEDEVAVVTFDAEARVVLPPRRADRDGKLLATLALSSMQAGLGTALHEATTRALEIAREAPHGHVVLLTDGFPFCGVTDPEEIVASVLATSGRATLTTLGYGPEIDAPLLASMATVGGGRFCHIDRQGDLLAALAAELVTMRAVATSKIVAGIRPAAGVVVSRVPHYVELGPHGATARLAPAIEAQESVVGLELSWDGELEVGRHPGALVTIAVGPPGGEPDETLEIPIDLAVGEKRGEPNTVVTRALCETVAGIALHRAALGSQPTQSLLRELTDAAAWIRGRAGAMGLDAEVELAPTLRALEVAREIYEQGEEDAPRMQAAAEAVAKRYDAEVGSHVSVMGEATRTVVQAMGVELARELAERLRR